MSVSKEVRQRVFERFDGHCSFCGDKLEKGWHVWDILPIESPVNKTWKIWTKENTEFVNLMPACKECGSVRIKRRYPSWDDTVPIGKMNIEDFRKEIIDMYMFCREGSGYSSSIRRAIRFGLIKETTMNIVFYFEKLQEETP